MKLIRIILFCLAIFLIYSAALRIAAYETPDEQENQNRIISDSLKIFGGSVDRSHCVTPDEISAFEALNGILQKRKSVYRIVAWDWPNHYCEGR
jgi:hypothetical protein